MAKKLYSDTSVQNIANAIRSVNGKSTTYKIGEMASAITGIKKTLSVTVTNGSAVKGSDAVYENNSVRVIITPNSGYILPDSVSVTGATSSYDKNTGIIVLSNVIGDVSVSAVCITPSVDFLTCSWNDINTQCEKLENGGSTADFCSAFTNGSTPITSMNDFVGLERKVTINSVEHTVRVLGTQHDTISTGGKAALTFQLVELFSNSTGAKITQKWNASSSSPYYNIWNDGTQSCDIRNYLRTTFKGYLPTVLQTAIKTVKKKTSAGNKSTTVNELDEDIFLLSFHELCSEGAIDVYSQSSTTTEHKAVYKQEGTQYKFFANNLPDTDPYNWDSSLTDAQKAIVIKKDKSGASFHWWLRSPDVVGSYNAFSVDNTGYVSIYNGVYSANGVAPAFAI